MTDETVTSGTAPWPMMDGAPGVIYIVMTTWDPDRGWITTVRHAGAGTAKLPGLAEMMPEVQAGLKAIQRSLAAPK